MKQLLRDFIWARRQAKRSNFSCSRPVLDLVRFGTKPGIVLDVGANEGGFASDILVQAPLMQVHCFEPNSQIFKVLQKNAKTWGTYQHSPRAIVNRLGVGSTSEEKELLVTGLHAASSFLPVAEASESGWPNADFSVSRRETVGIVRLDEYLAQKSIDQVTLLKLDVQGFELEALRGCGERLRNIRYIISEVQFQPLYENAPLWDQIVDYTSQYGFRPVVMDGFCFSAKNEPLQADILLEQV